MSRTVVLAAAISLALAACSGKESTPVSDAQKTPAQQPAEASTNPLLSASTLPFQAPQFDKIKDSDYLPAFEEGMRQHLADVRKIADSSEPATFDNTIVAMERSGETLTRVSRIFFGLVQADTNDARQKIQEEVAPKLAAHQDEINLDPKLFARVKSLYDQRDTLELDPVQKRLVEHYYDGLVRARSCPTPTRRACASSTWKRPPSPPSSTPAWWPPPPLRPSSSTTRPSWPAWTRTRSTTLPPPPRTASWMASSCCRCRTPPSSRCSAR
jgi:hypothetical protein